jgi:hypothetical protein
MAGHQCRIGLQTIRIIREQIQYKEAVMKKVFAAVFLGLWLVISLGCSSTPPGTISIEDIQKNAQERLGQNVVVVGKTEVRTQLASYKMFQLYSGDKNIWFSQPEGAEEPPQGTKVRVTGTLKEAEYSITGKIIYIEATKLVME